MPSEIPVTHFTWQVLTSAAPVGIPIVMYRYPDKTVTLSGNFDSSTVTIQGTNDLEDVPEDDVVWHTLTDPHGDPISMTSDNIAQILQNPYRIRPFSSGGGGSQSVIVKINSL